MSGWQAQAACQSADRARFLARKPRSSDVTYARSVCATCPVFDQCHDWESAHHDSVPDGIMYGYTSVERNLMSIGALRYRDWRAQPVWQNSPTATHAWLWAQERKAREEGIVEVLAIDRIYEIEDPEERARIISEYQDWQEAQIWRPDVDQLTMEARAAEIEERVARTQEGARRLLPPGLRPPCPNGHDSKNMHRERRKGEVEVWSCYRCKAKVRLGPGDWEKATA